MDLERYKRHLLELKMTPTAEKNIEAAGVISTLYREFSKEAFGFEDNSLVVVGGLTVEYYTAGDYLTADIDFVVSSNQLLGQTLEALGFTKEGRHWFRDDIGVAVENPSSRLHEADSARIRLAVTKKGYTVQLISPEDIFADRLRAVVWWGETQQIKWLEDLWESESMDEVYLMDTALKEAEEKKFFQSFLDFQKAASDYLSTKEIEIKTRYVNLIDGEIENSKVTGENYLEIEQSKIFEPNLYSVNRGEYASLIGVIFGKRLELRVKEKDYYVRGTETGFEISDFYSFERKPEKKQDFFKLFKEQSQAALLNHESPGEEED